MRFEPRRVVGVFFEVFPVRQPLAEEHVHDRAGERAVGAGLEDQAHVGLLHRGVVVDVYDDDLRAALLAGAHRMRHHVHLRGDRVGAPDHDAVRFRHLARVRAGQPPGAHDVAGPCEIGADRVEEPRILLGVPQAIDGISLHEPHRAGVEIGPHRLGPVPFLRRDEFLGDEVERGLPTGLLPHPVSLAAGAHQRLEEAVGVMDAFGVARDLGADDAGRVAVVLRAVHPADAVRPEDLDVERAGRRAIVRTGRMADADGGVLVHVATLAVFERPSQAGRSNSFDRIDRAW